MESATRKIWRLSRWRLRLSTSPASKSKSNKGRKREWDSSRLENLFETVESNKRQHSYSDRQALKFMVNNERHAVTWGPPSNHKGSRQQCVEVLRRIAQDLIPKFRK
jgi:hypothetical protein